MARSDRFVDDVFNDEMDTNWLALLTISHPDLATDIYVVNNTENIVSNGNEFIACPFELILPSDTDDGPPMARLRVDNVNQELVKNLRIVNSEVFIKIEIVAADDPSTIEQVFDGFALTNAKIDEATVTGTIGLDNFRQETFPARNFGPGNFPGLF